MKNKKYELKAIIFDFDGVLAESNDAKTIAFDKVFKLYPKYYETMMEFHRTNFPMPRLEKFKHLVFDLMKEPYNTEKIEMLGYKFSQFVKEGVMKSPEVFGTLAFLKEFSKKLRLFISSNTPQNELEEIISQRGISSYFVRVYGNPPVNKTDAVKKILYDENLSANQVIFIGDANSDYKVAKETGLGFIGRDSGLAFEDKTIKLYRDMDEIGRKIRKRLNIEVSTE